MRSKQYDILLVDDDAEDRMIIGEAFADLGCSDRVTMYDSCQAFYKDLEHIRGLSPLPGLVVLDYKLPGIGGSGLLTLLQNDPALKQIPVVVYSTSLSRTQKDECLSKGAVICLVKGITYNEVIIFTKSLCDETFKKRNPA